MNKSTDITVEETVPATSKKRQITATVISTSLTVALGIAASALIDRAVKTVHDRIDPPTETE